VAPSITYLDLPTVVEAQFVIAFLPALRQNAAL